jgi:hypothetical protein
MVLISFVISFIYNLEAAELPKLLTKHPAESLRYISYDGRYTYIQKKSGVLSLVTSFTSTDFLTDETGNDFLIKGSADKSRLIIESIPNPHSEMSMLKNHRIFVIDYGNTSPRFIGQGRNAKIHLRDEWVTYYDMLDKTIRVQNLITQRKFDIKLSAKPHPFFIPDIEMLSSSSLIYTEINEAGFSALVAYDLKSLKSTIIYKSAQNATRLELCRNENYLALGEFPYDGVSRGSKIQILAVRDFTNLSSMSSLYDSVEQDVGNILCLKKEVYFVKMITQDQRLGIKVTEAVKIDLNTKTTTLVSDLKNVTQLIEMDGRVLAPFRGDFYVIEGTSSLEVDVLKSIPTKEELPLEI